MCNLFVPYTMNYFTVIIALVAAVSGNELSNQTINDRRLSKRDATEFRLTKLLNIELGGELEKVDVDLGKTVLSAIKGNSEGSPELIHSESYTPQERYNQREVAMVLNQLYSQITTLKKDISNISYSLRECLVQSNIIDGKSFPVGTSYHRLCSPDLLNKEINGTNKYFPQSCKEIQEKGNNTSGIYQIKPKHSEKPFMVLCDMETKGGGWTHIQKRYDGSVDFFLGWRDYKFGFGDLGSEFWLGLENIYKLTGFAANELVVEIVDRENNKAYAHYKAFAISSEAEGYSLNTLKDFSGDAGDSLAYHLGSKFSTKDFDQDDDPRMNCAEKYNGAWWYKSCHHSNLNAKYINAVLPVQYYYHGIQWNGFRGDEYCHAKTRMMVRPVE